MIASKLLTAITLLASAPVGAATLYIDSVGTYVPLTIREGGTTKTCQVSMTTIHGSFSPLRVAQVASMEIMTAGCLPSPVFTPPVVVPPPTGAASTVFSASSYSTYLSLGNTYIPVKRQGSVASSLAIDWMASTGLTPSSGKLYWGVGESSTKYIVVRPTQIGNMTVSIPGSTATLTVR